MTTLEKMKVTFDSKLSPTQVLDNIRQRSDQDSLGTLFIPTLRNGIVASKVNGHRIRLRRRKFYGNSFEALFYGEVLETTQGTEIVGKFRMRLYVFVFMCIWFGGVTLGALMTLKQFFWPAPNCPQPSGVGLWMPLVLVGFGVVLVSFGKWLASGDKTCISDFLRDCCEKKDSKEIQWTSKGENRTRNFLKIAGMFGALFLILFVTIWRFVSNGDATDKSKDFLKNNPTVILRLGDIKSMSLPIWGFSIATQGSHGQAHLKITINGTKGIGYGHVDLEKEVREWTVTHATLDWSDRVHLTDTLK